MFKMSVHLKMIAYFYVIHIIYYNELFKYNNILYRALIILKILALV